MRLSILYRGPLSSCNYGCEYCPFAKHAESDEEHATDARALERFVEWVTAREGYTLNIFFTPWGEALIRRRYQRALVRLTNLPHVEKAAIQTNASCRLDWTEECDKARLGLWVTYHPTQTTRARFVARCREMEQRGLRFSVGVVGLREHFEDIAALRSELPPHIYLWVNAFKRLDHYYTLEEAKFLEAMDPLFPVNNQRHPSLDRACRAGHSVVTVDGNGSIRRCHFIKAVLGNIYEPGWESALGERPCTNQTCGCHIGYVHLNDLKLYDVFEGGILERIPRNIYHPLTRHSEPSVGVPDTSRPSVPVARR